MSRRTSRELRRQLRTPAPQAPPELLQRLKEGIPEDRFAKPSSSEHEDSTPRAPGLWGAREWGIAAGVVVLLASGLLAVRLGIRDTSVPIDLAAASDSVDAQPGRQREALRVPEQKTAGAEESPSRPSSSTQEPPLARNEVPLEPADLEADKPEDMQKDKEEAVADSAQPMDELFEVLPEPMAPPRSAKKQAPAEAAPPERADVAPERAIVAPERAIVAQEGVRAGERSPQSESLSRSTPAASPPPGLEAEAESSLGAVGTPDRAQVLSLVIEEQRVDSGEWRLEGRAERARASFADEADDQPGSPLFVRAVVAAEPVAESRRADRDELDPRSVPSTPLASDGSFRLTIPCPSGSLPLTLEVVDSAGVVHQRLELPVPDRCAHG